MTQLWRQLCVEESHSLDKHDQALGFSFAYWRPNWWKGILLKCQAQWKIFFVSCFLFIRSQNSYFMWRSSAGPRVCCMCTLMKAVHLLFSDL